MLPKTCLYRFRFPCRYARSLGDLDAAYSLPAMETLENEKLQNRFPFDFRIGWNETGLFLSLHVFEKKQTPWCRATLPEDSDGMQICLDTRNVKDIHRASRFCHRLLFMPMGSGSNMSQPTAVWLPIARAKEHPNTIDLQQIKMKSTITNAVTNAKSSATGIGEIGNYRLDVFIPGRVLTGFDPQEHPHLGFHFTIRDREHRYAHFLAAPPLPHDHDPSIWETLVMEQ